MIFAKPDFGYCDCGRPSMCGVTGWCGYCAGRPAMVAAKTTIAAPTKTLRDEFALAWLPHAINQAIAGYNHVCPTVIGRAQQIAYEAADAMLKARA